MSDSNVAADYAALKTANDQLREQARQRLFGLLDQLCAEISRALTALPGGQPLAVGRQEWEFKLENSTMVGERYGARYRGRTLLVEVGWPREPQHGYVPDGGLARGRVGLSQNIMLEPQAITEIILQKRGASEPQWRLIANRRIGEPVTELLLRSYFNLLLAD